MLRIQAAGPTAGQFGSFVRNVDSHTSVELTGLSSTATHTAEILKSGNIDALIFPFEWADVVRTLEVSRGAPKPDPALIVVAERLSPPILVRSLACGFDGAVETQGDVDHAVQKIHKVVAGDWTLESEPSMAGLDLRRGLLARELIIEDINDRHIADLVGTGLTDDDIALVMGWSIQKVRNRIENLLATNELAYRTQLAVIRASLLKVPDFS
ncbi:MAG: hypothetical protein KJS66_11195 [Acidobacteria bacterium]|jgi:DNA-binding NarL/FixJ family response regulator|nr:hypothetical protein [Acidobacteriota bacterium]